MCEWCLRAKNGPKYFVSKKKITIFAKTLQQYLIIRHMLIDGAK